ncbi:MAG: hypothetical protein ABDH61_06410 [Acidilobaceae archaeon]
MESLDRSRGIYVVALIYSLLAAFLLLLAYPTPNYSGVLVREGEVLYLSSSTAAVKLGEGRTVIVKSGLSLNVTGKVCAAGDYVHILSADRITSLSLSTSDVKSFRLPYALLGADVHCSPHSVFISGVAEGALKIMKLDARSGLGEAVSLALPSAETRIRGEGERLFVALDRSLVEVSREGVYLYELVLDMKPAGIAFYEGSPVVFGRRGSTALIYWVGGAKVIEIEIAGRDSSVDALLCQGYWCKAIVVPSGDWLRAIEFREWRQVRDVMIMGTRGFIYGGAGVSDGLWFSGKLVETGSVAVTVGSTSKAIVGAGGDGYFMVVEKALPQPRLYEYKVPPLKKALEARREALTLQEERVERESVVITYQRLGPLTDLLRGVFTAITLLSPLAAYLIRKLCC